jgi:hypothetical protein
VSWDSEPSASSAFGACLPARSSFLPALVAFAAAPRNDVSQVIAAVIVGDLHTCSDVLDGAYDDLVAYRVSLGVGPARMICVASEIFSARSVNRPTAVDLVKIAVASDSTLSACALVSLRPLYSTMKAPFLIGAVANRPRPVRERPTRKVLLRAISRIYDDSRLATNSWEFYVIDPSSEGPRAKLLSRLCRGQTTGFSSETRTCQREAEKEGAIKWAIGARAVRREREPGRLRHDAFMPMTRAVILVGRS